MQTAAAILFIVAPVFGMVLLGYVCGRFGLVGGRVEKILSAVVFNALLPLMLFESLLQARFPAQISWGYLAVYFAAAAAVFFAGVFAARRFFALAAKSCSMFGFASAYSNTWLFGLPLVLNALGGRATLPLFLLLGMHSLLMFPVITTVLELSGGRPGGAQTSAANSVLRSARRLCTNPIVLGLALGFAGNMAGLSLPGALAGAAGLAAKTAIPCALFVMGLTLSNFRIAASLRAAAVISLLKIFAHPLLVLLGGLLLALDDLTLAIVVIVAAAPPGINVFLFAKYYGASTEAVTTAVVAATLCSMATLPVFIFLVV